MFGDVIISLNVNILFLGINVMYICIIPKYLSTLDRANINICVVFVYCCANFH